MSLLADIGCTVLIINLALLWLLVRGYAIEKRRRKYLPFLLILLLPFTARAGDWSTETWVEEFAFQALHGVDTLQTLDIKHHANLAEGNTPIDGGFVIGPHPSDRAIYFYMGAEAFLHVAITELLSRYTTPGIVRGWETLTLTINAGVVHRNAALGLGVRL